MAKRHPAAVTRTLRLRRARVTPPATPAKGPGAVAVAIGAKVGGVGGKVTPGPIRSDGGRVRGGRWTLKPPTKTTKPSPARVNKPVPGNLPGAKKVTGSKKPQKGTKGTKVGASQVSKKVTSSQVSTGDQGGGVSPVTNGPSLSGEIGGGFIDSITGSFLGLLRLGALVLIVYLAWKYGRKYLK